MHNVIAVGCFIWGKIRTTDQETASQMALRNCSEDVVGKLSMIYYFSEEGYMKSSIHFGRGLLLVWRRLLIVIRSKCLC